MQALRGVVFGVLIKMAVAVQGERHRRVAGSYGDLLGIRPSRYPQGHESVTELVKLRPGSPATLIAGRHQLRRKPARRSAPPLGPLKTRESGSADTYRSKCTWTSETIRLDQLIHPVRAEPLRHHHKERPAVLAAQHACVAGAVELYPIEHLASLPDSLTHGLLGWLRPRWTTRRLRHRYKCRLPGPRPKRADSTGCRRQRCRRP